MLLYEYFIIFKLPISKSSVDEHFELQGINVNIAMRDICVNKLV